MESRLRLAIEANTVLGDTFRTGRSIYLILSFLSGYSTGYTKRTPFFVAWLCVTHTHLSLEELDAHAYGAGGAPGARAPTPQLRRNNTKNADRN